MKLWIKSANDPYFKSVFAYTNKRFLFDDEIILCRRHMSRLLRGTGKRLPKHGSNEIVEVEVTAR